MCLINFSFQNHPNYKLILVANRDEAYARPTAAAHFWEDEPMILAGRDLLQMGTWLGITKQGRFAALTNFREPAVDVEGKVSRGEIVRNYLKDHRTPETFLNELHENKDCYVGFNLIVGDTERLFYYNNIQAEVTEIEFGVHGLSNQFLNTNWPKVALGKSRLETYCSNNELIEPNELFNIHTDETIANDEDLPNTGVGLELERQLSPLFIKTPAYGTRSTIVLTIDKQNNVSFTERTFEKGVFLKEEYFSFKIPNSF